MYGTMLDMFQTHPPFKKHMIRAFILASRKRLESIPDLTLLPSTRLRHAQAFAHVGEYAWVVHALTLSTSATSFDKTTGVLYFLHPLAKVDLPPFLDNFHHEMEVTLNQNAFVFTLAHSPRFSTNCLSAMVYELLWDCFVLDDLEVTSTSSLKYEGTLLKVIFRFQYHVYFLHFDS
jgi:hypothetical protein